MKKIFLLMFFMVFLVGTISAFEWDNIKQYNEDTKTITIKNSILKIIPLGDVAEIKLDTPLIYNVMRGNDRLVAEFTINNLGDYENVFNDMEFYNSNTGKGFTREFEYKYKKYNQPKVINDYKIECQERTSENGTTIYENCQKVLIGNHTYIPFEWKLLDHNSVLSSGNITIGIFTDVLPNERVEWIPTLYGERIDEWAVWTESLNQNIVAYYKLDETNQSNTTVLDSTGNFSGTNNGGIVNRSGQISTGYSFGGNTSSFVDTNMNRTWNNFTWTFWGNTTAGGTQFAQAWEGTEQSPAGGNVITIFEGANVTTFNTRNPTEDNSLSSGTAINDGDFHFVVVRRDGTNKTIWIDGNLTATSTVAGDAIISQCNIFFGARNRCGTGAVLPLASNIDEMGYWDRALSDSEILDLFNNGTGISFIGVFRPIITLNSPIDNFNTTNITILFNGSIVSLNGIVNVTLFIDGVLNETNSSGINDTDYLFTKTIAKRDHNWTYESCNVNGCTIAPTRDFSILDFVENSQTFNASAFETESQGFTINITTNGSTPSSAELIYNGTTFSSATITSIGGNDFNISRTIDIPLVNETKSFFFNVTIDGIESSSLTQNQIINLTDFQFITTGLSYINISFKNETVAEESVTAEIDLDWTFFLGSGTVVKSLSFTNTTENEKYEFNLLSPINRTLTANISLTYNNLISEQRSFSRAYNLTNVTTNQTLFLLPTADGVFVTFQTVTVAEQVISGVASNVTKGTDLISTGVTDDAGLVQYFLDPDTTYVFTFFKEGFDLVTSTLKPTQPSFTIIMGAGIVTVQNDTTKGISYTIRPLANSLSNNTEIEFNLTFSSIFFGLDSFGFVLKNSTGDIFNITTSTNDAGGFLSRVLNTGNNTDIQMEVFWTIEGNQTNVTRLWKVLDTSDEGFSIKTFFDDLSTFLNSGIFGLTSFGLGIIIFLIIIITTGVLSTKFGITSPAGISIIVFSMVLFFDVGLGIIPNPIGAVPNFPTIFIGVIFLGLFIKEAIIR